MTEEIKQEETSWEEQVQEQQWEEQQEETKESEEQSESEKQEESAKESLLKANKTIENLKKKLKETWNTLSEEEIERIKNEAKEEWKKELLIDKISKQVWEDKKEKIAAYFQKWLSEEEVLTLVGAKKSEISEEWEWEQEIEVDTEQKSGWDNVNVITFSEYEKLASSWDIKKFKEIRWKIQRQEIKLLR